MLSKLYVNLKTNLLGQVEMVSVRHKVLVDSITRDVLTRINLKDLWVHGKVRVFIRSEEIVCFETRIQSLLRPNTAN